MYGLYTEMTVNRIQRRGKLQYNIAYQVELRNRRAYSINFHDVHFNTDLKFNPINTHSLTNMIHKGVEGR